MVKNVNRTARLQWKVDTIKNCIYLQCIDRGKKIAFYQGAKGRRQQNQALIASESFFHGNFATGLLCLKASTNIAY